MQDSSSAVNPYRVNYTSCSLDAQVTIEGNPDAKSSREKTEFPARRDIRLQADRFEIMLFLRHEFPYLSNHFLKRTPIGKAEGQGYFLIFKGRGVVNLHG